MKTSILLILSAAIAPAQSAEKSPRPATDPGARVAAAALPSIKALVAQVPGEATYLEAAGRPGFIITPKDTKTSSPLPWVWYAPTIGTYPNPTHAWMFKQFLAKGIAIAGVDVGESMGNPKGRAVFSAFHKMLVTGHGFSKQACLMPQSRGGLMFYNWAAEHPEHVACIAGIYTVCDMNSWPGLKRACGAYGMTESQLAAVLAQHNPIDRLAPIAQARVPILHIHGNSDKVVPLERNSGELARRYRQLGGTMKLIIVPGKGHEEVTEFFRCQAVVDFVIANVRPRKRG